MELEKVLPRLKVTIKTGIYFVYNKNQVFTIYSVLYVKSRRLRNKIDELLSFYARFTLDSRDWRSHLEQMKQLRGNITTDLGGTKAHLNKIYTDIENTLDKVKTRETYLNKQLEPSLVQYRSLQVSPFRFAYHTSLD